MNVRSLLSIAITFPLFLLIISCDDSSITGNISGSNSVNGQVRALFNFPVSGLKVEINGNSSTTDSEGRFHAEKVSFPYDLVIRKDSTIKSNAIYKNADVSDVCLDIGYILSQNLVNYSMYVTVPSLIQSQYFKLYFLDEKSDIIAVSANRSNSVIYMDAPPDLNLNGKVILLSYLYDNNGNINFQYFAEIKNISFPPGISSLTISDSLLQTVEEKSVNCNIIPPPSTNQLYVDFMLNFKTNKFSYYNTALSYSTFYASTFQVRVPSNLPVDCFPILSILPGTNVFNQICYIEIPQNTTAFEFTCPAVPEIISPPDYAINVDSNTVFSAQKPAWNNILVYNYYDSIENESYSYCTTEDNITLKNLSSIMKLQPNRTYRFSVTQRGYSGCNSVGEYLRYGSTNRSSISSTSKSRYFTTKP